MLQVVRDCIGVKSLCSFMVIDAICDFVSDINLDH